MWRLTWVRDWLHLTADRLAVWRRPGDRLEREIRRWMVNNAKEVDGP